MGNKRSVKREGDFKLYDGLITLEKSAELLKCSKRQVQRLMKKYNWPKKKYNGNKRTYLYQSTVEQYKSKNETSVTKCDKKMLAFSWYGGKFNHLDWLLPLLPGCDNFVDVFGGSMSVLLNRDPRLSNLETYNDLDGNLVNFFKVLREHLPELQRLLAFTPYSRAEYEKTLGTQKGISDIEKARLFFIKARATRAGLAQKASLKRWAYTTKERPTCVSRYWSSIEGLENVCKRVMGIQIENDTWENIISRYDSKDTLFYLDPPYCHESRKTKNDYANELSNKDHEKLSSVLKSIKGKFALSGYNCEFMENNFGNYNRKDAKVSCRNLSHSDRQESLWFNYEIEQDLFTNIEDNI